VVEDKVVVEVKSVSVLDDIHRAQILSYLRVSGIRVGLLMNFARPKLKFERFIV
jgi:GxxExxY protein